MPEMTEGGDGRESAGESGRAGKGGECGELVFNMSSCGVCIGDERLFYSQNWKHLGDLLALARSLEEYYKTTHKFWGDEGEQLQRTYGAGGIRGGFMRKMRQFNGNFEWVMSQLRKGQSPGAGVSLDHVRLLTQEIIKEQNIHSIDFGSDFSIYMTALREVGSILYYHLHPSERAAPEDSETRRKREEGDRLWEEQQRREENDRKRIRDRFER